MESSLKFASMESKIDANRSVARKQHSAEVRSCGPGGPRMGAGENRRDRQMDRTQMGKREGSQPPLEEFQGISTALEDRQDGKDAPRGSNNSSQGHHHQNVDEGNYQHNRAVGTSLGSVDDMERMASHHKATTSPRCGFKWLEDKLKEDKERWMMDDQNETNEQIDEFNDYVWHYRYHKVPRSHLRHIIGRGGRMLQKLENFLGVFAFVREKADNRPEIVLVGQRHTVVLGEFIINMLVMGHYTIMDSLARAGF